MSKAKWYIYKIWIRERSDRGMNACSILVWARGYYNLLNSLTVSILWYSNFNKFSSCFFKINSLFQISCLCIAFIPFPLFIITLPLFGTPPSQIDVDASMRVHVCAYVYMNKDIHTTYWSHLMLLIFLWFQGWKLGAG